MLESTGISAVSTGGNTIHYGLGIKPGTKLFGLNKISKAALGNRLSEVICLIIDELSKLSSDLWTDIESRLVKIFMIFSEKAFAGLSVMTVADYCRIV